jgi:S-DNA-T family DNA segregation ATPase FtsK/SpoIIIE
MGKKGTEESLLKEDPKEVKGLLLISIAFILLLSLLSFAYKYETKNLLGLLGYTIAYLFHATFGLSSYLIPPILIWAGVKLLFQKKFEEGKKTIGYLTLLIVSLCILLSFFEEHSILLQNIVRSTAYSKYWHKQMDYHLGGKPFFYLYKECPLFSLKMALNDLGVFIVFTTTLLISIFTLFKISLESLIKETIQGFESLKKTIDLYFLERSQEESRFLRFVKLKTPDFFVSKEKKEELLEIHPERELKERPSMTKKKDEPLTKPLEMPPLKKEVIRQKAIEAQKVYNGDFTHLKMPPNKLLTPSQKQDTTELKKNLKKQAEVLEETLLSFGIEAKVGEINCGPTITSFEVHPAIGVKVQKIKALENDIALNMEAKSIRIIAPIPGKAAIGIEVPNGSPQEVSFKEMLETYQAQKKTFHIPLLLGKAVNGDFVMSDLAKMPHCIIAGATGSGKSVCINTIVMSILMNARPDEIRLLMVDPKKVELSAYSKLPHMLAPVITEPQGASAALNWLVKEMENRYDLLRVTGVRNIEAFNKRAINKEFELSLDREIPEKLHYIVGIIDELADLMMISSNDIETPIARIAQMARAVGIHLILATQRPSREVITGIIKANFPTRIAFKVASRINSQIILDETGAESLLGNGDMLFLPPGTSHLIRAQGAFIRDEDINRVVQSICEQSPPNYVIKSFDDLQDLDKTLLPSSFKEEEKDPLYKQAEEIVTKANNASTTFLQRKLKIGYARAASLMDLLEERGVISEADGVKGRKVLRWKEDDFLEDEEL